MQTVRRVVGNDTQTHRFGLSKPGVKLPAPAGDPGGERRAPPDRVGDGPLRLGKNAIGPMSYPPAAVTCLLVIQAAIMFGTGRVTALLSGVGPGEGEFNAHGLIVTMAAILLPVVALFQGSFEPRAKHYAALWGMRLIAPLAVAQIVGVTIYAVLFMTMNIEAAEAPLLRWLGAWFIGAFLANGVLSTGFEGLIRYWEAHGTLARRIVVFGGSTHGQRFIDALVKQAHAYVHVAAFFDDRAGAVPSNIDGIPYLGNADELIAYVQREPVDEIVIALPWSADNRILEILRKFRSLPVPVRLAPDSIMVRSGVANIAQADSVLAPTIREQPLSPWGLFVKGVADRAVAAIMILLLSPILAAIAILIKLDSPGPILFRQKRLGFNNRAFWVYKFRTMQFQPQDQDGLKQARADDPRVTRLGGFLRRWSLDELPQLINVLQGNMSLVGPRPHPIWKQAGDLWDQGGDQPLDAIIHEYASRHRVKPGITGWAQISGFRGETATVEKMRQRVEHDLYYIDHWSLWLDFKVLALTFSALFRPKDAY